MAEFRPVYLKQELTLDSTSLNKISSIRRPAARQELGSGSHFRFHEGRDKSPSVF